ncbi:uncharacterized protein LOC128550740 [Mercenaria mercenaria]|uniref:uncharacterized protein LOC128550740 n=1 Tax=Mercenaria mercenaria TaxID=6596 RepID=UPI00234E4A68|nr:uncharacterized protein LOC128550740 [Mercenaria mercenaria]
MTDGNSAKSDKKTVKSRSSNRHYCCVCSNYRGKTVDNKTVTLHRFPANKILQNAWLKRIRTVSARFVFNERNDRLCSAHFKDGIYDRKLVENNVPSVFILQDGRVKQFEVTSICNKDTQNADQNPAFEDTAQEDEDFLNSPLFSAHVLEYVSVKLHDYHGNVNEDTFSVHLNKETQTVSCQVNCAIQTEVETDIQKPKSTRSFGTQTDFSVKMCNIGVQARRPDITIEDVKGSEMCMFYTGLPNVSTFNLRADLIRHLRIKSTWTVNT